MRYVTSLLLGLGLLLASAGAAHGHVGLVPGTIAPGETAEAQVVLAHGCGEEGTVPSADDESSPTTAVSLAPTDGVHITPLDVEGWTLIDEGPGGARWTVDEDAGVEDVVFLDVEVDANGMHANDEVWVPVTQECLDGTVMAWDHPGPADQKGDLPAMLVRAAVPAASLDEGGLPTPVLIGLVVVLAIALGGGVTVVSLRRS